MSNSNPLELKPQVVPGTLTLLEKLSSLPIADRALRACGIRSQATVTKIEHPARSTTNAAIRGGLSGTLAMTAQVLSFMWLHTTIRYQYQYGSSMKESFLILYRQGGMARLYQGLPCALLNGPLIRFGSTAANSGTLAAFDTPTLRTVPIAVKTFCATSFFVVWRVFLMPVDFLQTVFQVRGNRAISTLKAEYRVFGPKMFWRGSVGIATNSFIGTYAWFGTFNALQALLNRRYRSKETPLATKTLQNGLCGLTAAFASSIFTNGIDVLKTHRQTGGGTTTYLMALRKIRETETFGQFWCRGLRPRLALDGIQGFVFSMLWKFFEEDFRQEDFL